MSNTSSRRMNYVLDSLGTDREYSWLCSRRDAMQEQVAAICNQLSEEERAVLLEYWGISQEMMLRMEEIACFMDEL